MCVCLCVCLCASVCVRALMYACVCVCVGMLVLRRPRDLSVRPHWPRIAAYVGRGLEHFVVVTSQGSWRRSVRLAPIIVPHMPSLRRPATHRVLLH